jgi:hypothetical protein
MHSKVKGTIGHLTIATELIRNGCEVFTELGDNSKVDLIALYNNRPIKIQVKAYTSEDSGSCVKVYSTKSGPNYKFKYSENEVDIFAIYVLDTNDIFYVPSIELCKANKMISVRIKEAKNNQTNKIRSIENYKDFIKAIDKQFGMVTQLAE